MGPTGRQALLVTLVLLPAACSSVGPGGAGVGGTCTSNAQCQQTCVAGDKHYPGGMCTFVCASDAQCPGGSVCIDDQGGICAVACTSNNQCAGFGRGFVCDARDRVGALGGTLACRVP